MRQTIFGDGLLAYRSHCRDVLEVDEALACLRKALAAHPDLWHAWAAVIRQLADAARLDEAHKLALEATEKFPLLPQLWLDVARICRRRGDPDGELMALRETIELSAGWAEAVRELAEFYERAGDLKECRSLLERAVERSPLDAAVHGDLARVLWKLNCRDEAVDRAAQAVRLAPGLQWAWDSLRSWTQELKRPQTAVDLARELTLKRGGEARSWLVLASMLTEEKDLDERLAALDKATQLNPRNLEGPTSGPRLLAEAGRFEEALEACRPAQWGDNPPSRLRGRAAWIEARRENYPAAVAAMKAVLVEEPRYYWGWCQLAGWHRHTGANADVSGGGDHPGAVLAPRLGSARVPRRGDAAQQQPRRGEGKLPRGAPARSGLRVWCVIAFRPGD